MTISLQRQPGLLWRRVVEVTRHARTMGALHTIATRSETIDDHGIRFLVRILARLERKELARKAREDRTGTAGMPQDPFQPYEKELYVADASATHVCILNKFNVVDHHLLIVTREFEHQESPLEAADFEAMWRCMAEYRALAFYNGGLIAGASQPHRHLQMVPLPLAGAGCDIPIEPLLAESAARQDLSESPHLPFVHVISATREQWLAEPARSGRETVPVYRAMLERVGLRSAAGGRLAPYNLLVSRQWMLLVPRSEEKFAGVAVNSLGYAGALLVRDEEGLAQLRRTGPLQVLKKMGVPRG